MESKTYRVSVVTTQGARYNYLVYATHKECIDLDVYKKLAMNVGSFPECAVATVVVSRVC